MGKRQHITAFYAEALLLIAIFVGIILLLTQVFGASRKLGGDASALTAAVSLAGNAAETFAAADGPEDLLARLNEAENAALLPRGITVIEARYGDDLLPAADGAYSLQITWEPESSAGDTLVRSRITVYRSGREEPVYTLDTAVFWKEAAA